jgi:hypothetical protein
MSLAARLTGLPSILAGVVLIGLGTASAANITFRFEGVVTGVFDPDSFLDGSISEGTVFGGAYTFDSETPNHSDVPQRGSYLHRGAPNGIMVGTGNYSFGAPPDPVLLITIGNDVLNPGDDSYVVRGNTVQSSGPTIDAIVEVIELEWFLSTPSADPLSGVELLTLPPPLEPWNVNVFQIEGNRRFPPGTPGFAPLFQIRGVVTSIVPEPATWILLGSSIAGLALSRLRRWGVK